jgi:hypothetical protein
MPLESMVYCVDVGSTLPNKKKSRAAFAWCTRRGELTVGGTQITDLVDEISVVMASGKSVALGFEAPLHIPVPDDPRLLSKRRKGESDRAWSAPAGGYVATLALHQSAWILRRIHKEDLPHRLTLNPDDWTSAKEERLLYCWEAFVSGAAHARGRGENPNVRDAATGLNMFNECAGRPPGWPECQDRPCLSLIGAAALWSGWSRDLLLLGEPTAVFRAETEYDGDIASKEPSK